MTPVQRSFLLSAVERSASLVILFVSTAVLARLLKPEEFGVYAVVGAITTIISVSTQEFGGANFIIQKASLSDVNVRSAFTITLVLSLALSLGLWAIAEPLGAWFGVEGLAAGVRISALGFLITPFSTVMFALLRRDLMFGAVAIGNLVANVVTAVTSITLALKGYSYLSPVWGQVAGTAAQGVCFLAVRGKFSLFRPSLAGYGEVIHFGIVSSGITLINLIYNTAPQFLLARIAGFAAVGLYSRAVAVTSLFDRLVITAIGPVIMPAFASHRRAGQELKPVYLRAMSMLAALQWPFLLCVAILAEPIIKVWLGSDWLPAAPLVRWLCAGSLAMFAGCLTYPVLVAAGHVRNSLTSSLISLTPSLAIIFVACFFGVEAVAVSALVTLPFQAAVAIYFIARRLGIGLREIAGALRKGALVAGCCGVAALLGDGAIKAGWFGPLVGLVVSGALITVTWFAVLAATDHPLLAELKSAIGGLRLFRRAATPVPAAPPQRDVC